MGRTNLYGVGLTAHYTAYAWHRLGVPEAERFVTWPGRLLHWGMLPLEWAGLAAGVGRPMTILLESRLRLLEHLLAEAGPRAVIELGAGLSPRGTAYTRQGRVNAYYEVDQPHVSALKRRLVGAARGAGQEFVAGSVVESAVFETLRAHLARDAAVVGDAVNPDAGPVAAVAEGLLAYLPRPLLVDLLAQLARLLAEQGGGVFFADINPANSLERFGAFAPVIRSAIELVAQSTLPFAIGDPGDAVALWRQAGFREVYLHDPATHQATAGWSGRRLGRGVVLVLEARI